MPFSPAIEACRVPDERLAGAYEETSAAHRSWIKTTLALAEATYPAPLLRELPGRGRILRFGKAPLPECPCPVWSDRAPRIERTALPDTAVLWAHPDALPADDGADVVYAGQIIIGEDTPLVLGAGLEGCWLHTGLPPDFFMNERLELSCTLEKQV